MSAVPQFLSYLLWFHGSWQTLNFSHRWGKMMLLLHIRLHRTSNAASSSRLQILTENSKVLCGFLAHIETPCVVLEFWPTDRWQSGWCVPTVWENRATVKAMQWAIGELKTVIDICRVGACRRLKSYLHKTSETWRRGLTKRSGMRRKSNLHKALPIRDCNSRNDAEKLAYTYEAHRKWLLEQVWKRY